MINIFHHRFGQSNIFAAKNLTKVELNVVNKTKIMIKCIDTLLTEEKLNKKWLKTSERAPYVPISSTLSGVAEAEV